MRQFADSFARLPAAEAIAARLIGAVPMFAHLREARILMVASQRAPVLHGHPCQAFVAAPRVQGPFKWFFDWMLAGFAAERFEWEEPDFVILFDAALWAGFDDEHQEHLVYHELRHIEQRTEAETGIPKFSKDDGRPMWRLVPHDAEFFFDEVERYGPEVTGHVEATVALASGAKAAAQRQAEAGRRARGRGVSTDDGDARVRHALPRGAERRHRDRDS